MPNGLEGHSPCMEKQLSAEQELTVLNFRLVTRHMKFSIDKGKATTHR